MSTVEYNVVDDGTTCAPCPSRTSRPAQAGTSVGSTEAAAKVKTKDLSVLTRQLATLLHAGMPLVAALSALAEQQRAGQEHSLTGVTRKRRTLASVIEDLAGDVSAGNTLAGALAGQSGVFPPLYVNMVAAGEAGGTLEQVLFRLAEVLHKRVDLAAKVKAAVAYPAMMIAVAVGVVTFLLSFVVPSITQIFLELNRDLPLPTRMLIAASSFLRSYLLVILVALFGCCVGLVTIYRNQKGRFLIDRMKLRTPLFGKLLMRLEIARLTRTLGVLLASGLTILTALDVARRVVQNRFVQGKLDAVRDAVSRGDDIADATRKTSLLPPIAFHILATSQAGGDMEDGFLNIAQMYEDEIETATKTITTLLEPVILLIMGVVVGFIVLAILLPIFEINQVI